MALFYYVITLFTYIATLSVALSTTASKYSAGVGGPTPLSALTHSSTFVRLSMNNELGRT
jgi:hypothetical protein